VNLFIDTNIFIIDLRYPRDRHFKINRLFLDFVPLLLFPPKYNVEIIPSHELDSFLPETSVKAVVEMIYEKASSGDALVANIAKGSLTEGAIFVSWYALHFKHLLSVKALTPMEFMQLKANQGYSIPLILPPPSKTGRAGVGVKNENSPPFPFIPSLSSNLPF